MNESSVCCESMSRSRRRDGRWLRGRAEKAKEARRKVVGIVSGIRSGRDQEAIESEKQPGRGSDKRRKEEVIRRYLSGFVVWRRAIAVGLRQRGRSGVGSANLLLLLRPTPLYSIPLTTLDPISLLDNPRFKGLFDVVLSMKNGSISLENQRDIMLGT